MRLYHLSFDTEQPLTKRFFPRTPKNTMVDEDKSIPRICLSHHVLGCINAMPGFENHMEKNWNEEICAAKAVLYSIDTKDIPTSAFYDSFELYERGYVPDAIVNQECWCLSPITMTGTPIALCESSDRIGLFFCSREENRDYVYSVIDRVAEDYASRHKSMLDKLSLFYIMNYHFKTAKASSELYDDMDLDFEFCNLANSPDTAHLVDAFNIYQDVFINDAIYHLSPYGVKTRESLPDRSAHKEVKPSLSDLISQAESRQGTHQDHTLHLSKQFEH